MKDRTAQVVVIVVFAVGLLVGACTTLSVVKVPLKEEYLLLECMPILVEDSAPEGIIEAQFLCKNREPDLKMEPDYVAPK